MSDLAYASATVTGEVSNAVWQLGVSEMSSASALPSPTDVGDTPVASAPPNSSSAGHRRSHDSSHWRTEKHTVVEGDSLSLISEIYQSPIHTIQKLNDLHPDSVIYPGKTLRVPTPLRIETHIVVPGESLTKISNDFDTPVAHVRHLNGGLSSNDVIHVGTTLTLLRGTNAVIQRAVESNETGTGTSETLEIKIETATPAVERLQPARYSPPSVNRTMLKQSTDLRQSRKIKTFGPITQIVMFPARVLNTVADVSIRAACELAMPLIALRPVRLPTTASPKSFADNLFDNRHRVVTKPGESLASIASAHKLSIRELQKANGIVNDAVDVGQVIRVTRLDAFERAPRLRRRTKRHLFEKRETSNGNVETTRVDTTWRHRSWRYSPRGSEAEEFFSRCTGVGRGDVLNGERIFRDKNSVSDKAAATNEAMTHGKCEPNRTLWWEHRLPRRSNNRWHLNFCGPIAIKHDAFITSGFGWRWGRLHAGVDLAANEGTPVRAATNGTVKERVYDPNGYGWLLRLQHEDGWETRYAHCKVIDVTLGQKIRKGQHVAQVGNTGRSFGPHLHFEVRRHGIAIDPTTCSKA